MSAIPSALPQPVHSPNPAARAEQARAMFFQAMQGAAPAAQAQTQAPAAAPAREAPRPAAADAPAPPTGEPVPARSQRPGALLNILV